MWYAFVRLARYWKLVTLRHLLYLPHLLRREERRLLVFLSLVILVSGGGVILRVYARITVPAPEVGGSYTEGMLRQPRTINPLWAFEDADRDLVRLTFSGLLAYSDRGVPEPDLAERYEVSPDGKTYIVTLRENIFWHDGVHLSADDVLFTIKIIQNPQYKSVLRANWQGVAVEKLDERTIRFSLRTSYAPFIENLTTGIIPKHRWETISPEQALLHELNLKPVGSGPYQFSRFKQEKDGSLLWYELRRNTNYHREGPYLRRITFIFFHNKEEQLSAWRKGEIEGFGPVSPADVSDFDPARASVTLLPMSRVFGIFFNEKRASLLAEKYIREAIAKSVDTTALAREVIAGGAIPSGSPLPLLNLGQRVEGRYPYDPDAARTLLKRNGWQDLDGDGIREKKILKNGLAVPTPLRFALATSDWTDLARTAEAVKSMLRDVGIEIVVEPHPFPELEAQVLRPRNFDILLFGQVYGYEPDPFAFWHSSQVKDPGLNVALYASKRADAILEVARILPDPSARQKKLEEFTQILSDDLPAVFIYTQVYLYLLPADMKGVSAAKISLPSDRFNAIHLWHRETKRVLR